MLFRAALGSDQPSLCGIWVVFQDWRALERDLRLHLQHKRTCASCPRPFAWLNDVCVLSTFRASASAFHCSAGLLLHEARAPEGRYLRGCFNICD
jgi:hypothetical protein